MNGEKSMRAFMPARILLPNTAEMEKWAVIACDQFTSQPEYWQRVRDTVGEAPSALHLILPEAELGDGEEARIAAINAAMEDYLARGLFRCHEDAFVYVERSLMDGQIRRGLVGMIDLEQYDYSPGSQTAIRATESTVAERIPPRVRIRKDAALELPHVLLLCDDEQAGVIEPLSALKDGLQKLYDFELLEGGGHIAGWLVQSAEAEKVKARLEAYEAAETAKYSAYGAPLLYAVGDGNHSLATAKACYEALKEQHPGEDLSAHPARFALVELENIHDPAQSFGPIHRIVKQTDPAALLAALQAEACAPEGFAIRWFCGEESGTLLLDPARGKLPVGILQRFLDDYLRDHPGQVDYIHGDDTLRELAAEADSIGFLLPVPEKGRFFESILADGVLPRKTFSMGHAQEKRYYLEARRIR